MERGVAIGGGQQEADLLIGRKAVAHHVNLVIGVAGEHMQRRVEAEDFLDDRGKGHFGKGGGGRKAAMLQQGFHPIAQRMHRGLMPGVEKKDAGADHLIRRQPRAFFFGGDQMGDEVIGRLRAALVDIAAQEA